jgi:phenylacetic acid degradation operon negative regulatory protein
VALPPTVAGGPGGTAADHGGTGADEPAAGLWTPSRRGGASWNARALLLTVLGEFVLPDGGTVWTSTLLEAMGALGVEDKAVRQALARSAAADLVVSERVGRQARWRLTPSAEELLASGAERIYRFGSSVPAWDGRWLLVLVRVPEGDRHLRHRLRSRLGWLGFAPLTAGVWVSPWVEREPEALATLHRLGLGDGAYSFRAERGDLGDLEGQAATVWRLDDVETRYEAFIDHTRRVDPGVGCSAFAAVVALVHQWRSFPASDPGLPAPLLPEPWRGREAAELFTDRRTAWSPGAWAWWRSLASPRA